VRDVKQARDLPDQMILVLVELGIGQRDFPQHFDDSQLVLDAEFLMQLPREGLQRG